MESGPSAHGGVAGLLLHEGGIQPLSSCDMKGTCTTYNSSFQSRFMAVEQCAVDMSAAISAPLMACPLAAEAPFDNGRRKSGACHTLEVLSRWGRQPFDV